MLSKFIGPLPPPSKILPPTPISPSKPIHHPLLQSPTNVPPPPMKINLPKPMPKPKKNLFEDDEDIPDKIEGIFHFLLINKLKND